MSTLQSNLALYKKNECTRTAIYLPILNSHTVEKLPDVCKETYPRMFIAALLKLENVGNNQNDHQ